MPQLTLESLAVQPILTLQSIVAKIITDNNLGPERDDVKIVGFMKQLNVIQKQLGSYSCASGQKVASMLAEFKENIAREVGGMISEDVSQLLNVFASSCKSIENNYERLALKID